MEIKVDVEDVIWEEGIEKTLRAVLRVVQLESDAQPYKSEKDYLGRLASRLDEALDEYCRRYDEGTEPQ